MKKSFQFGDIRRAYRITHNHLGNIQKELRYFWRQERFYRNMRLFETKWSKSREVGAFLGKGSKLDFSTILGGFYYLVKCFEAVSSALLG